MENPEAMSFFAFAKQCLQLRPWAGRDVASFVCRFGNFSVEVRLPPLCVETPKDSPLNPNAKCVETPNDSQLNPNAKVFDQMQSKDPKNGIGKSQSKKLTRKSQSKKLTGIEMRKNDALKRELEAVQAKVKETQDILDGKDSFGQHDFKNWTPPSVSQETARGLKTLIRHSRRKVTAMCKLLESVPEVSAKDKSTTEKLDEGRKGGGEWKVSEAQAKRGVCLMLQCLSDGEGEPPREEILKEFGLTKEAWSRRFRVLRDDEPSDDDLKWLEISKEDVLEMKKALACVNAFGIGFEEKMRKYWNAFRDGCKGRDVSGMG